MKSIHPSIHPSYIGYAKYMIRKFQMEKLLIENERNESCCSLKKRLCLLVIFEKFKSL